MPPVPGLRVFYEFISAEYRSERQVLTVHSVDASSQTIETDHGTMTQTFWDWLAERGMISPLEA